MKLIIGLGNPGKKYENTRHNVGFMVVDALARQFSIFNFQFSMNDKFNAEILEIKPENLLLVKPQTYMNNSGMAVVNLVNFYKVGGEDLWIIHDDLDIPIGRIKISKGKGTAGHHGIESIVQALSSTDFVRFRLGIARPNIDNPDKFVLMPFLPQESDEVRKMIKQAILAIEVALKDGPEKAMSQFNR